MVIPNCKNGHVYNCFPHSDTITDTQGHTETMYEECSVGIFPISFSMSLADDYVQLLGAQVDASKRKDYLTGERID
jgi:hypothetical protein